MTTPKSTRQKIQEVALELFVEQGYEKTSLRGIAERLNVTKPAIYYHFQTKEAILISLFQDLGQPLAEIIAWAQEQPRTLETKKELLTRYSIALHNAAPLFRFMQENQATVRQLSVGQDFKDRVGAMAGLIKEPGAPLADQVRCISALFTVHFGTFAMQELDGDPEDKRQELLDVAIELVSTVHSGAV
ncbi:TetR/AcrR family transcriptional regulator [Streptomyces sp. NPDC057623]|jgi:AcrR family transcriptional regulator|uniref:Regulatory protein n=1 Tax=Streptomyces fradiae TaxID=1906 RepID=Q9RP98_STRFR|nr:regulatory protein [Streptomyces fradiae]